jgi:hypothetical protein
MNDKDLERGLRSQYGPREEGYVPTQLPMSLGAEPAGGSGPSWILRTAVFVPVAVAGALAVGVVSGILAGPGPNGFGSSGSASPSPSSTPVASAGIGTCGPGDVVLLAEPWGAAAGSRGTVVTVTPADGHDACTTTTAVSGQVTDANGSVLVRGEQAGSGGSIIIDPDAAFTVGVAWSNWCGDEPAAPVALWLRLEGWPEAVAVKMAAGGGDPVPPCLGDQQPSTLSLTELQPSE